MRMIYCSAGIYIAMAMVAQSVHAVELPDLISPPGLSEVVRLWQKDPPATSPVDKADTVTLRKYGSAAIYAVRPGSEANMSVFLPKSPLQGRPAIILCPGGGYAFEQMSSEGHAVAEALTAKGIAAFVLKYRLPNQKLTGNGELPFPQQDVLRAIQVVRAGADHWKIDAKRVGVMGFSAGGHLAATAATMYDDAKLIAAIAHDDSTSKLSARPDFAVLVYPVITMTSDHNGGTRNKLIGANADAAAIARFSPDQRITPQTPPLFIVVAEDDGIVPATNSHMMADAAKAAGVPHELLSYPKGNHGFALGRPGSTAGWLDKALAWLATQGVVDAQ